MLEKSILNGVLACALIAGLHTIATSLQNKMQTVNCALSGATVCIMPDSAGATPNN